MAETFITVNKYGTIRKFAPECNTAEILAALSESGGGALRDETTGIEYTRGVAIVPGHYSYVKRSLHCRDFCSLM
jgi:hypothetical protein